MAEAYIEPSVGSVGDSYDNALAETIIGLYKTELISLHRWRNAGDVEFATLRWVDWHNNKRLFGSIGHVPPSELEAEYERWERRIANAARSTQNSLQKNPDGSLHRWIMGHPLKNMIQPPVSVPR